MGNVSIFPNDIFLAGLCLSLGYLCIRLATINKARQQQQLTNQRDIKLHNNTLCLDIVLVAALKWIPTIATALTAGNSCRPLK
ncbi:MAG: hypothetical protein ACFFCZ_30060 [Promethearchaeota archaeon]